MEGVDPQRDPDVVCRIAQDVVRDHDVLSLTGAVAPVADHGAMIGELVARVSGFGPLQPFLDDPAVEEVWINSPGLVRKQPSDCPGSASATRLQPIGDRHDSGPLRVRLPVRQGTCLGTAQKTPSSPRMQHD